MTGMRVLVVDVETAPAGAWVYSLWNQNIGLKQVHTKPYMLSWASRWLDEPASECLYEWAGDEGAYERLWDRLDKATHVLHFNGKSFDEKWVNHELIKLRVRGRKPYSPVVTIDLLTQSKRIQRSLSNKLQFLSTDLLGLEGKIEANALDLFIQMQSDDPKVVERARARMERYCKQDVNLLPKYYREILPWLKGISANLYNPEPDGQGCLNYDREKLVRRGLAYTTQGAYQRFRCSVCGTWSRATKRSTGVSVVNAR